MVNHAAPYNRNCHPLVITFRVSKYPTRTLGEHIKKWRLERRLYQKGLAKKLVWMITIVNLEKGRTKPRKRNLERVKIVIRSIRQPFDMLAAMNSAYIKKWPLDSLLTAFLKTGSSSFRHIEHCGFRKHRK